MPRLHFVKKARKDNPAVKAGESYYWWKFPYGSKRYSRTEPRRSQLTQSEFLGELYDLEDAMLDEYSEDDATSLAEELQGLLDSVQERFDNMPEALQDSSESGQLLQERIDGLESWISEIEGIDWENTSPEEAAEIIKSAEPF